MKNIRYGLFETNSSSAHCLSVRNPDQMELHNNLEAQEDGYVHVILDEFGWSYDGDLYGQEKKLSYILTMAAMNEDCTNFWDDDSNDDMRTRFTQTKIFQKIEDIVRARIGSECKGIFIDDFGGIIDHQSYCDAEDIGSEYGISIEEFIFSSNVKLIIDHDNH